VKDGQPGTELLLIDLAAGEAVGQHLLGRRASRSVVADPAGGRVEGRFRSSERIRARTETPRR
jgi:hypothetical protein